MPQIATITVPRRTGLHAILECQATLTGAKHNFVFWVEECPFRLYFRVELVICPDRARGVDNCLKHSHAAEVELRSLTHTVH